MTTHAAPGGAPIPCMGDGCRICQLIDPASPHYREDYRRLFHPEEFPGEPWIESPPPTLPSNPTAAESLGLVARMRACPHWRARSDCGCGVNGCAIGKGRDGLVSHADCFACLSGV